MEADDLARPTTLPQSLGRLRVALDDAFARASQAVGLTPQQAELLCAAMSPSSVKDLAEALRCDRSNVTRLVDRAFGRGHVNRHGEDEDGRIRVVELTPDGRRLASQFLTVLAAQTESLRASWPAGREDAAAAVLNEISEALEAQRERAKPRRRVGDGQ